MLANTAARPIDLSRPCWHCTSYHGLDASRCYAVCMYNGRRHIHSAPVTGCVFWARAPGSDDGGPPEGFAGTMPATPCP